METPMEFTRREALRLFGAIGTAAAASRAQGPAPPPRGTLVERNDAAARQLLGTQVVDQASPFRGSVPDEHGLHPPGSAAGVVETLTASFAHPESAFAGDPALVERIALAAGFLERAQGPRGNVDLLITNFDSPPDTGFVVHGVAAAAAIARRHGHEAIVRLLQPFLQKAGAGLAAGGIHTPNHRWVVCQALAQIHGLWPDERYVRRIDEWLAEGVDIDGDGQFTERSTAVYGPVTDRALCVVARQLGRPELLEPVRANLRALPFLLHADGEVVTEISRRQDQFQRGTLAGYWLPLALLARSDRDAQFAALARLAEPGGARLPSVMEHPELAQEPPAPAPLPDDFRKEMPSVGIVRIRRGVRSATVMLGGSSRWLSLRSGAAVIEGVRMAAAFFGKGQFVPDVVEKTERGWRLRQALEAPYYQPLAEKVAPADWLAARARRRQSEVCRLAMAAEIEETARGLRVRLSANGTAGVPVAVEIGFRAGGEVAGCRALAGDGAFALEQGTGAYRAGADEIRFGPGAAPHRYVQVRGAEPRLPGTSVHVTGFTPFEHSLAFECGPA